MAVATPRSPGHWTGRVAAAVATMPVPITEANQLGPRLAKASEGRSRSRGGPRRRGRAGAAGAGRPGAGRLAAGRAGVLVLMTSACAGAPGPGSGAVAVNSQD